MLKKLQEYLEKLVKFLEIFEKGSQSNMRMSSRKFGGNFI